MLCDRDLKALLPAMAFETDDPGRPFVADDQVQPASIDLRLDRHFWRPRRGRRGRAIDLRHAGTDALDVARLFRAHVCATGQGVTLGPGQIILARTFEKFTIPDGHTGRLAGRSSYARLGLSIVCTGDFINPGWRGRMPLQLVNHGVVPIVLTPHVHICQLIVTPTSGRCDAPYGSTVGVHTYAIDDTGGPSRFYLDRSLRRLRERLGTASVAAETETRVLTALGTVDAELLDRFSEFVGRQRGDQLTHPRELMERFADRDTRRHAWARRGVLFAEWAGLLLVAGAIAAAFRPPYGAPTHWLWVLAALLAPVGLWAKFFARTPAAPFTRQQVEQKFPTEA